MRLEKWLARYIHPIKRLSFNSKNFCYKNMSDRRNFLSLLRTPSYYLNPNRTSKATERCGSMNSGLLSKAGDRAAQRKLKPLNANSSEHGSLGLIAIAEALTQSLNHLVSSRGLTNLDRGKLTRWLFHL